MKTSNLDIGEMFHINQLALNTSDMAGTLRFYSEVFGFSNAGGQAIWGSSMRIQGLEPEGHAVMWWMLGRQKFFQLELFHHSKPKQRPLPSDWRPCDHGWVRFGIVVSDFDVSIAAMARYGVSPLSSPVKVDGLRRVAIRDPYVGVIVEIMEGKQREPIAGPSVAYITTSVSDLDAARVFYRDTLGFRLLPLEQLHDSAYESLWGLSDAIRDGFLVQAGDNGIVLEILQYHAPAGRPRRADYRTSDQGIMNIAICSRQKSDVLALLERVRKAGFTPPYLLERENLLCGYITAPEREMEITALSAELDAGVGFVPTVGFFGSDKV